MADMGSLRGRQVGGIGGRRVVDPPPAGVMIFGRDGRHRTPNVGLGMLLEAFFSFHHGPFLVNRAETPGMGLTWFDSQEIVKNNAGSCRIYAKLSAAGIGPKS